MHVVDWVYPGWAGTGNQGEGSLDFPAQAAAAVTRNRL